MSFSQHARRARRPVRQSGVTLIESLVTLSIAATLAAIGVPSLRQFHDRKAVDSQYHALASALRRARSEALTRGELVTVCALDGDSVRSGDPACLESGKDWSAGWLVFTDRGTRGEVDDGDKVIVVHQAPARAGNMVATQRYLTYRHSGELLSMAAHYRALPPGQPPVDEAVPGSALICVNRPGKARLAEGPTCEE
jgi:type IV fimbrial biogenesis protein FimT